MGVFLWFVGFLGGEAEKIAFNYLFSRNDIKENRQIFVEKFLRIIISALFLFSREKTGTYPVTSDRRVNQWDRMRCWRQRKKEKKTVRPNDHKPRSAAS